MTLVILSDEKTDFNIMQIYASVYHANGTKLYKFASYFSFHWNKRTRDCNDKRKSENEKLFADELVSFIITKELLFCPLKVFLWHIHELKASVFVSWNIKPSEPFVDHVTSKLKWRSITTWHLSWKFPFLSYKKRTCSELKLFL